MTTDAQHLLDELADAAERMGAHVQRAAMGGDGGGLARVRERWVLYLDTQADPMDQILTVADQIGELGDVETIYLSPALRQVLDGPAT